MGIVGGFKLGAGMLQVTRCIRGRVYWGWICGGHMIKSSYSVRGLCVRGNRWGRYGKRQLGVDDVGKRERARQLQAMLLGLVGMRNN